MLNSFQSPNKVASTESNIRLMEYWGSDHNKNFINRELNSANLANNNSRRPVIDYLTIGAYDASVASAHKIAEMDKKLDKIGKALNIDFEA
jgi:Flp pilus assembly CpaE family ATPase